MTTAAQLAHALAASRQAETPYRHWLLGNVLPAEILLGLARLPLTPASVGDTQGKRETHNASRIFLNPDVQARFPVCADLAAALQAPSIVTMLEQTCGAALAGNFLRIEYCLDTGGFWLEPHTDIGAKKFTFLIYLSDHPDAEAWGTDILDTDHRLVMRAPGTFNSGLIFVPGPDTWHGFSPRPIAGVRRSLIVNYVIPAWRSRQELAFPQAPVKAL